MRHVLHHTQACRLPLIQHRRRASLGCVRLRGGAQPMRIAALQPWIGAPGLLCGEPIVGSLQSRS